MSHKILVIGPLNEGDLAESYARAFERLGMEVVRFDSNVAMNQASRFSGNRILRRALQPALWNAVNRQAVEVAERARPDLIFAVKCAFFHPETVRRIRKSTGAPFVNHYPDHPYLGRRWMPGSFLAAPRSHRGLPPVQHRLDVGAQPDAAPAARRCRDQVPSFRCRSRTVPSASAFQ
jgi:hypothetical protein